MCILKDLLKNIFERPCQTGFNLKSSFLLICCFFFGQFWKMGVWNLFCLITRLLFSSSCCVHWRQLDFSRSGVKKCKVVRHLHFECWRKKSLLLQISMYCCHILGTEKSLKWGGLWHAVFYAKMWSKKKFCLKRFLQLLKLIAQLNLPPELWVPFRCLKKSTKENRKSVSKPKYQVQITICKLREHFRTAHFRILLLHKLRFQS